MSYAVTFEYVFITCVYIYAHDIVYAQFPNKFYILSHKLKYNEMSKVKMWLHQGTKSIMAIELAL